MENRPKVGVGVFVIKEGKILFQKRKGKHDGGKWSLAGGHLEFGESIQQCAQREVMEEMGVKIKNIKLGPYTNDIFEKEGKHYLTIFVLAEYDSGEPKIMEPEVSEDIGWFAINNFPKPLFLPIENLLNKGFDPVSEFSKA